MKKVMLRFLCIGLLAIGMYALPRFGQVHIPFIDSCISWAAYPFIILQHKVTGPFKEWGDYFKSQRELMELSERYKAEREELLKKNIELASLIDTWSDIEELVLFKKRYSHTSCITSQIILKHFSPAAHFFYIDAGSRHGVTVDMVAVYKNFLLGRVSEVFPLYSRVALITDSDCKVAAFCQNAPYAGIHEGSRTLHKTRLTYVFDPELQAKKKIKKDDLVISSGQGGVFPKGFGLGKVQEIEYDNFQCMLTLQPLIDFRKLKYCIVVAKGAEYNSQAKEQDVSVPLTTEVSESKESLVKKGQDEIVLEQKILDDQSKEMESSVPDSTDFVEQTKKDLMQPTTASHSMLPELLQKTLTTVTPMSEPAVLPVNIIQDEESEPLNYATEALSNVDEESVPHNVDQDSDYDSHM